MSNPGLTNTGFIAPTTQDEVNALNALFLANVDAGLDLDPTQPFGQIIGIFAQQFAQLSQLGATVYNSMNPAAAAGALLANLCSITGTFPQIATYSQVTCNLSLNAGTTVLAGSVVAVNGQPNNRWATTVQVTNSTGFAGVFPVLCQAETPGPQSANANTITVIQTPTVGWTGVNNPLASTVGLAADTDTTLRQKRQNQLAGVGQGDVNSIRAALLKVSGVLQAFVYENVTMVGPDANGVPPKSFRAVIWDGSTPAASNTAVANAIWANKPTGIQPFGGTTVNVTDSQGIVHAVGFDRAAQQVLFVSCTTTPSTLTTAQTTAIKNALAAYASANFNLGVSVIALPFRAAALITGVDTDVPVFQFDFHAAPTNTGNLTVTGLQIATLSTTNILVNGI